MPAASGSRSAPGARASASADFDRALSQERSLLITWLNRGTLHLVRREDYPLAAAAHHAAAVHSRTRGGWSRRASRQRRPSAAVAAIERALAEEGPLTRAQLGERIAAAGVRTEGQALMHLLMLATLRGVVVRGPMSAASTPTCSCATGWDHSRRRSDRDRALAELARRYLRGPRVRPSDRDLAQVGRASRCATRARA